MCRHSFEWILKIHFRQLKVVPGTTYGAILKTFFVVTNQWHRHCFHCTTTSDEAKRSRSTKPTECPQRLGRVFRLALPSLGIFELSTNESPASNRMPTWPERPFPPGVAGPGHPRNTKKPAVDSEYKNESSSVQPNAHMARATFSAWGRRARAFSDKRTGGRWRASEQIK